MDLKHFQQEVIKNVLTKFDQLSFQTLYVESIQQGLITKKEVQVVMSKDMCDRMFHFLEIVKCSDEFFDKLNRILIKINKKELRNEICDRYYTLISNVLHIDGSYTTESLDEPDNGNFLMQECWKED